MGITIVFILLTYPHLVVSEHFYRLGDVAEKDIKAPKDFLIEDDEATQANSRRAVTSVLTVYDHDTGLAAKIGAQVTKAFDTVRAEIEATRQEQFPNSSPGGGRRGHRSGHRCQDTCRTHLAVESRF